MWLTVRGDMNSVDDRMEARKLLEPKRDTTGKTRSAFIESRSGRIKVVADAVEGNVGPLDESLDVVRPEWNRS
jgi:hypothetical protein